MCSSDLGVDITQDDATEDGPLRVCVARQKRDANGRISFCTHGAIVSRKETQRKCMTWGVMEQLGNRRCLIAQSPPTGKPRGKVVM